MKIFLGTILTMSYFSISSFASGICDSAIDEVIYFASAKATAQKDINEIMKEREKFRTLQKVVSHIGIKDPYLITLSLNQQIYQKADSSLLNARERIKIECGR